MTYSKLDAALVHSTVWREPNATRIVWITLLAMKDANGEVMASVPGLADVARVTLEECETALGTFLSPDPHSRNPANEGRRIEKIPGGWFVLNHEDHRLRGSDEESRRLNAERQRRFRERHAKPDDGALRNVTGRDESLPNVTITKSNGHTDTDTDTETTNSLTTHVPCTFAGLWGVYPKREGSNPKKAAEHAYNARLKEKVDPDVMRDGLIRYRRFCEAKGWVGTGYVMQAKRFFGPGEEYAEEWKAPRTADESARAVREAAMNELEKHRR